MQLHDRTARQTGAREKGGCVGRVEGMGMGMGMGVYRKRWQLAPWPALVGGRRVWPMMIRDDDSR